MGNVELTSGELRLDDLSLPQIDLADIRRNATLLTQEARLFHGTLRENVTLGRPMASDDELVKVLELCGALEFVNKLPMGLEHLVMEGRAWAFRRAAAVTAAGSSAHPRSQYYSAG